MKDEIKEILKEVNKIIDNTAYNEEYSYFEVSHISKLLDYMTNLQEEIKRQEGNYQIMQEDIVEFVKLLGLRDDFIISEEMPEKIKELQEENERLKEENKHIFANVNDDQLLRSNAMNWAEAQDYKSRNEKAIEYIKIL